jgi:hypothetical protein
LFWRIKAFYSSNKDREHQEQRTQQGLNAL